MLILQITWLGTPVIEYNGCPVRMETRKALALLAYLSLAPQHPSRETLATMFWPEFDQQHSLTNLRRNLFSLTRSLPPELFEADRERIGLRRAAWTQVDVDEFREHLAVARRHPHPPGHTCPDCLVSLEKAVTLYKGDFLEGFNLKDCPGFDEWQSYQRESLQSDYGSVLEKLAAYYQDQSEWEKAIQYARSWLALDHLNEPAQRTLIGLYNQSGQRSMALRQYELLVNLLQDELGQAPQAETLSLYHRIVSMEASGRTEGPSALSRSSSQRSEPLLKTKLFIPPLRVDRVARPRLFELLDAGSQRSLTLISAPAGFGKTTLLASWAAHTDLPVAWFSIDEGDNDPVRFVAYLITALDSVFASNLSAQFQDFSHSLQPSIQLTLVQLINHLAEAREPFILILDDYQSIHSREVHQALAFVLEKTPACMHLVIATRSDPPISLSLLRARDQLVEIRMSDLRFRSEEAAGFLNRVMALQLSNEEVSSLEARTEGWVAGLQMAALAIRTLAPPLGSEASRKGRGQLVSQFIKAFSGSNRYILDYLGEEVLRHIPDETRRFLLQTSILERFSGPLCDAVTQSDGSQDRLTEFEKQNLFIVALDNERQWYRYHPLFADLLLYMLKSTLPKSQESGRQGLAGLEELHRRAADWLEKSGLIREAVHHFIAAGQYNRAADLIEIQAKPILFNTGQTYTLQGWLAELPDELVRSRPRLLIAKAWTLIIQDHFSAALEQLELCQRVAQEQPRPEAERTSGEIALVQGVLAELRTRDVDEMRTKGLLAWEKLPSEESMLRGLAAWLVGASYLFDGDTLQAEYYLSQAVRLCRDAGNNLIAAVASLDLSNVRVEQGRYREAYHILQQTLREMSSGGRRLHPSLGYLYYGMGQILLNWNELEEAERQLQRGMELVAQDIPGEVLIMTTAILPHIKLSQGKREEALRLAEECLQRVETYPLPYIPTMVKANLARFWMRVGDQARIEAWLDGCGLASDDAVRCIHEAEYLTLAKVLIRMGRTEEAMQLLDVIHDHTYSQGRNGKRAHALALQAIALKQSGEIEPALKALETSLRLAQPEGRVRLYLEEGKPMEELLQLGAARGAWRGASLDSYTDRLLLAFQQDQARLEVAPQPPEDQKLQ